MKTSPVVLLLLAVAVVATASPLRERRETETLDAQNESSASAPLDAEVFGADPGERTDREKRLLLEQKVQIGNSVKNAVLNLIFGKINAVIDSKNKLVSVFERANAAKNLALLGPGTKRQPAQAGFKSLLAGVLTSSAGSSFGGGGGGGSNSAPSLGASFGASLGGSAPSPGTSSSSSSFGTATAGNGGPTTDGIPTFEGNRVSLEIPEQLFGSSFTLVTNISQLLGDVILNTARRVQRFVESLKPKFRGLFGVQSPSQTGRKRDTEDEIARAKGASVVAGDLAELHDNRADSAPAASGPRDRSEAFKSLTGLEPFDFDFAALDKLVKSGDDRTNSVTVKVDSSDIADAAATAGKILDNNLKRVASVRRRRRRDAI